ncbi:MAG: sugar phosphorylase [Spirochaetia bacterium]|jgi:sucrose phosphorylase|nr:sugar phosphorylase [Spirochaetia bacterium]
MNAKIAELLRFIYENRGGEACDLILPVLEEARARIRPPGDWAGGFPLDEGASILITYGDQFREEGRPPLAALKSFLDSYLLGTVRGVHILPFSPYSSDDGFSVIDFREVNPEWGTWKDVEQIAADYTLMADLVLNHCSKESPWFKAFLQGQAPYNDYFITVKPGTDVSGVFRPRTHPLLTEFKTASGPKLVWTTFSSDQVDLNYANPAVLAQMLGVFLMYVEKGARIIRLDAIAYLWKELGTPCLHHPKTHAVVKLMRAICDEICPWTLIITETNVPHRENISYFGAGDEARMVYQFALPPLVLHAFIKGDSSFLQEWGRGLVLPRGECSFFNFCASHDGIGVLPAKGILPEEELALLVGETEKRGGFVSRKATPQGNIPYELNINYLSALAEDTLGDSLLARKFIASQSILLAMPGVPGIYVHSIIGSRSWLEGVKLSGINRRINREKLDYAAFRGEMAQAGCLREEVFSAYENLLAARMTEKAFHPLAGMRVLPTGKECFALLRESLPEKDEKPSRVLCLTNLCPKATEVSFTEPDLGGERCFTELVGGDTVYPSWEGERRFSLLLEPFEVLWLKY